MHFVRLMRALHPKTWLTLARREIVPIAIFLGVLLPILAFFEIAEEVGEGETRWFDESVLLALRTADFADPIGPRWFEMSVMDITALGGFAVLALVTLFAVGYLLAVKRWGDALMLLVATLGGALISEGLKVGFNRPRPDLVAHIVEATSMSFPSGHAMLSAVTYLTLGALIAGPTIRSEPPFEYTSAVSMKFTPASKAASMMRLESVASVRSPNIMVPRQRGETMRPLAPSCT